MGVDFVSGVVVAVLGLVVGFADDVGMGDLAVSVRRFLVDMGSLGVGVGYFFAVIVVMVIFVVVRINLMRMLDFTVCMNFLIGMLMGGLAMFMHFFG